MVCLLLIIVIRYFFDKTISNTLRLADWSELKSFILAQLTKILNQNKDTNEIKDCKDIKILIVGNGLSKIPIYLYDTGYTNITITDISINAINTMKEKYSFEKYPNLKWKVMDCTEMKDIDDNSFDFVFDKGVSDTLQYRRPSKQSNILLQKMFTEISRILKNKYGKYLCITPRRKVPLLKLVKFNWSVKRMQIRKFDKNTFANAENHNNARHPPFLYLHACSKFNHDNYSLIRKNQECDRRKQFEKACDNLQEFKRLNLKFEPLIEIKDIDKDVIIPFKHYEEINKKEEKVDDNNNNQNRLRGIIKDIDAYYMIHGIVEYKRKFGKKLMFYQVSLLNDKSKNKKIVQCIAERSFVAKLSNPNLKKEYATNYLTKCGDEVKVYGKFGITNKGGLALFVYYVSLIQYHPNWKYE